MTAMAPFPDIFLPLPGEPAVPFKVWEQIFKIYCLVIDVALLPHCLGTEGQKILYYIYNIIYIYILYIESAGEQAKCMTRVKSSFPVHAVQVQVKGMSRQLYRNARSDSSASHSTAS